MLDQAPKIPNYEIMSPLGSGTSGQVWLAKDRFGERRAIKMAHIDHISSSDYQRRFRREVRAQQQLYEVSSHVPRIFDYDEKHIPPYIVMDYINGMDLNRMIAIGEMDNIDLQTRLHWIEAIASTLTKAHSIRIPGDSHGIIHRDIKPQNIRIQGQRPYLLDFSISLTSDVEIDSTQDAMTLRYVAPEVIPSAASDIFSFGLVAFEILYEVHPLTTYDEASKIVMSEYINYVQSKLQQTTWRLPSTVDSQFPALNLQSNRRKLDMVFQKVLSVEPTYRFETPKEFSDALISILLGPPTSQEFQIYTSKTTTETPQVTIQLDESIRKNEVKKQQREAIPVDVSEFPQDTRRFSSLDIHSWSPSDSKPATDKRPSVDEKPLTAERSSADEKPATDKKPSTQELLKRAKPASDLETIELDWTEPELEEPIEIEEYVEPKRKRSTNSAPYIMIGIILVLVGLAAIVSSGNDGGVLTPTVGAAVDGTGVVDSIIPVSSTQIAQRSALVPISATDTSTPTLTLTPTTMPTDTPMPTATYTVTSSPTSKATYTVTSSPMPNATYTVTPTATVTLTDTATLTSTATLTLTSTPSNTPTVTSTPTTPHTSTHTVQPTGTLIPTSTAIATATPQAWQIEQKILTLDNSSTAILVVFMPSGCESRFRGDDICLEQGVHIDLEPVSNEKYDLCVRSALCTRPAFGEIYDPAGAGATKPVVGVNLAMAQNYCEWRGARLPNAAEWQMLITKFPDMHGDVDEWIKEPNSLAGQSQIFTHTESEWRRVWLEDSYLSNGLSFRCVQPE